jgi:hypothetical protein
MPQFQGFSPAKNELGRAGGGRTHTVLPPGDFKTPMFVSIPLIYVYIVYRVSSTGGKMSLVSIISIDSMQTAH